MTASDLADLYTPEAIKGMSNGTLPDLTSVCNELYRLFSSNRSIGAAMECIPVLKRMQLPPRQQLERFKRHYDRGVKLIDNKYLRVVLIHWPSGKISSIHGHPAGGCVFRVLEGSVEELRYTNSTAPQLLATSQYHAGSMAYIDDTIGLHAVGNPFNVSAGSLHVYTPAMRMYGNA